MVKSGKITKAIITAAGRGTRFLPASKAYQKEMVPLMHKPQLQWVIEEAIESGITDIAVVVRKGVDTFKNYLNQNRNLWRFLERTRSEHLLESWVNLKKKAKITLFYQKDTDPYGNGTPFILARKFVKKDPFIAMWGDDIIVHVNKRKPSCIHQLISYYEKYNPVAVMSVVKVPRNEINRYGSYEYYKGNESKIPFHAKHLVEKPDPNKAPSLMANACRFILTYEVISELEKNIKGKSGEVWLADAIDRLIQKGRIVITPPIDGSIWVPVGDPINWLKANLIVALNEKKYKEDTKRMMKEVRRRTVI